jgi:hypothetical protein
MPADGNYDRAVDIGGTKIAAAAGVAGDVPEAHVKAGGVVAVFPVDFRLCGLRAGMADWILRFLSQEHGFDPQITPARAVSWFWAS